MDTETLPQVVENPGQLPAITYTKEQMDLIKRVYAKDATDDELALFIYTAKRLRLDVLARQIHFSKRAGKPVFIVAIDGYRLNAERTKLYAPGKEPSFTYDAQGAIVSATAYVKKFIGGEWHEIAATAFMSEYKPTEKDGGGDNTFMWRKMPHNQLAKCAEALALRRAFPNELSDTVSEAEMAQVREPDPVEPIPGPKAKTEDTHGDTISEAQAKRFFAIAKGAGKSNDEINDYCGVKLGITRSSQMLKKDYEAACKWAEGKA